MVLLKKFIPMHTPMTILRSNAIQVDPTVFFVEKLKLLNNQVKLSTYNITEMSQLLETINSLVAARLKLKAHVVLLLSALRCVCLGGRYRGLSIVVNNRYFNAVAFGWAIREKEQQLNILGFVRAWSREAALSF